jgi:hypothetical protein
MDPSATRYSEELISPAFAALTVIASLSRQNVTQLSPDTRPRDEFF